MSGIVGRTCRYIGSPDLVVRRCRYTGDCDLVVTDEVLTVVHVYDAMGHGDSHLLLEGEEGENLGRLFTIPISEVRLIRFKDPTV